MEGDRLSGGIAPLMCKFVSRRMIVVGLSVQDTLLPYKELWFSLIWRLGGHWNRSGCLGEEVFSCFCQDLNPRSSSVYPSHGTDYAAPYLFEDNAKIFINTMRWDVWLVVFDP
jgi:hypothetical protein